MRLSLFLACLWATTAVLAASLHLNPNHYSLPRGTSLDRRAPSKCPDLATRDPATCQCYPEYVDNGKPKKECRCPDAPNTALVFTEVWCNDTLKYNETASCVCRQPGQTYNTVTRQCECPPGYKATRNNKNELTCKKKGRPTTVTVTASSCTAGPTGGCAPHKRRNLREAVRRREAGHAADLEAILECTESERACKVGGDYRCIEIKSRLNTCGACPGEALDCSSLPNADEITCLFGRCTIDTCRQGSVLRQKVGDDHVPFYCDPKRRKSNATATQD